MARTLRSDKVLFWEAVALVCASLVMLYSASAVVASNRDGDPYGTFFHQLPWAMLGLVALLVMMRVDYHVLKKPEVIWPIVAVTIVALMAVFLFPPRKGATRWITLFGLHFQPSELAKLVAVVFTAAVLERRMHRIDDVKWALGPVLLVAGGMAALVVAQRDIGTPLVLVLAVVATMVAAGLAWRYLAGMALVSLPVLAGLIVMHPYRMTRLMSFLDPNADLTQAGYQLYQSKIALGVGGLFGVGLGHGMQKLSFLPEPENDFIFAVIGEELGLLGTTAMVIAFAVIAWRGLRASLDRARSVRIAARRRPHDDDRGTGHGQHDRSHRHGPHEGSAAAARQRRRIVTPDEHDRHGDSAEHFAAGLVDGTFSDR